MLMPVGFQEELYGVNAKTKPEHAPRSLFYAEPTATSWYNRVREDLALSGNSYRISNNHKFLLSTQLRTKLPALKVREVYQSDTRIAYHHKVGHNMVESMYLNIGGIKMPPLTTHSLNVYAEYYTMPGDEHKIAESVGAIPRLEDWNTTLPAYELSPILPFFLHWHTTKAFPIHMLDVNATILIVATFRLRLTQLLRMQVLKGDQWIEIIPDLTRLDGVDSQLEPPIIRVEYTNNLPEECDLYYHGVKSCD